ncbi:MAG: hypothetical protein R2748_00450 [Bryobacterales bacterium]
MRLDVGLHEQPQGAVGVAGGGDAGIGDQQRAPAAKPAGQLAEPFERARAATRVRGWKSKGVIGWKRP